MLPQQRAANRATTSESGLCQKHEVALVQSERATGIIKTIIDLICLVVAPLEFEQRSSTQKQNNRRTNIKPVQARLTRTCFTLCASPFF